MLIEHHVTQSLNVYFTEAINYGIIFFHEREVFLLTVPNISMDSIPSGRTEICTGCPMRVMMVNMERWKLIGSLYQPQK
jgi:hypothetical protein